MSELRDKFIDDLSEELDRQEIDNAEDILADKISEYDSLIQKNMTDMEVIIKLGDPKDIVKNLSSNSKNKEDKIKNSLSDTVSELLKKPEPVKEKSLEEEFGDYTPIKSSKPAVKGKKGDKKDGKGTVKAAPAAVPKAATPSSAPKTIQPKEPSTLSKAKTISSAPDSVEPAEKISEKSKKASKPSDRKPVFHIEPEKEISNKITPAIAVAPKTVIPEPISEPVPLIPEHASLEKEVVNEVVSSVKQEPQAEISEDVNKKKEKNKKVKEDKANKVKTNKPVSHKIKKEKRKRRIITKFFLFLFIFATGIIVPLGIFYGLLNMFLPDPMSERLITLGISIGASIVALIINHGLKSIAKRFAIHDLKFKK